MPSHYALYIYVFYCIVHDNGLPSGKSSNIAVVQCINQSLQTNKKQHLYINVDLLESSQIGVIFILCIYRVNHIVHRCHTCSLLLIQANAFENLFILKVFYVALQRYFVFNVFCSQLHFCFKIQVYCIPVLWYCTVSYGIYLYIVSIPLIFCCANAYVL